MATFRIYLCTYRRNSLLPRALNSLLNQSFTDWICELHNDDPQDQFPAQLVRDVNDSRITLINHPHNFGATPTFNLVFQKADEPFVSLLEDDNWWEPNFLSKMLAVLETNPDIQVAWANMRLWKEEDDGTWTDTQKNVWNIESEFASPKRFEWPQLQQMVGALHSQGAMVVRTDRIENYIIPPEVPCDVSEAVRERSFDFPILLVPEVLANFAITQQTARSNNGIIYGQMQVLLAASFLKNVPLTEETYSKIWSQARSKSPKTTNILIFSALACRDCRKILKSASLIDWLFWIATCVKRPFAALQVLKATAVYPTLWQFLDQTTDEKSRQAKLKEPQKL